MNRLPHRYPSGAPAEVLAWVCAACGHVVREYGPADKSECAVDWRRLAKGESDD